MLFVYRTFTSHHNHFVQEQNVVDEDNPSIEVNITVVTAFIDIGSFTKGKLTRSPDHYVEWFYSWSKLLQPVVFFYNKRWAYEQFAEIRHGLPTTYVYVDLFNKSDPISRRMLQTVTNIFAQDSYPKHHPPTTNPHYVMIMHAKYDLMEAAINRHYFDTNYTMWLDIGLFREYKSNSCFTLTLPPSFDPARIAFNKVGELQSDMNAQWVIWKMPFWICGGTIFGTNDVVRRFVAQYRNVRDAMMLMKLAADDQMTIYSMFTDPKLDVFVDVEIQTYQGRAKESSDEWFYLGYIMKRKKQCPDRCSFECPSHTEEYFT